MKSFGQKVEKEDEDGYDFEKKIPSGKRQKELFLPNERLSRKVLKIFLKLKCRVWRKQFFPFPLSNRFLLVRSCRCCWQKTQTTKKQTTSICTIRYFFPYHLCEQINVKKATFSRVESFFCGNWAFLCRKENQDAILKNKVSHIRNSVSPN